MSLFHTSNMNRRERRETVRMLLAMRHVYPGDVGNYIWRDAMRLDPKLPAPRELKVEVYDASGNPA